jgi:hypothetical protein
MKTFHWTNITTSDAVKIVGENIAVRLSYAGATDLIIYVKAGINSTDMQEIVDSEGNQVTRYTATGTGTRLINISGLTPGSHVGIGTVSGTGTVTAEVLTGK